ncbi:Uncharacterised protein [Bordetella pertussis]|nr:Uncharacterised protein [Bordetella pertussis]
MPYHFVPCTSTTRSSPRACLSTADTRLASMARLGAASSPRVGRGA